MADLATQLANLKDARASGALIVQHGDERVQYRSVSELNAAIAAIEQELASAAGTNIVRRFHFTSSKGL